MNNYRIRYKPGVGQGLRQVRADSVNGFQPSCDTYVFRLENEIVAAIPKVNVASIERVKATDDDEIA